MNVQINANIQWLFTKDEPSGQWIAVCNPLKLTMEGDTYGELMENLNQSIQLLFESLVSSGEFDQFLRDRGWSAQHQVTIADIQSQNVRFDVPFELIARNGRDSSRATYQ